MLSEPFPKRGLSSCDFSANDRQVGALLKSPTTTGFGLVFSKCVCFLWFVGDDMRIEYDQGSDLLYVRFDSRLQPVTNKRVS